MFFRTININKPSESVSDVYIDNVEVKRYKNDGELEIRITNYQCGLKNQVIRVPLLANGDADIEKVFSLYKCLDKQEMLKIAKDILE